MQSSSDGSGSEVHHVHPRNSHRPSRRYRLDAFRFGSETLTKQERPNGPEPNAKVRFAVQGTQNSVLRSAKVVDFAEFLPY